MAFKVQFFSSIDALAAPQWNRLRGADHPFLRHEFLSSMESNGCVGDVSGWIPHHAAILDKNAALLAAAPLYLKTHSWGEFVFDWSWADAYQQQGVSYYPKLVCAIPFTPVECSRLLVLDDNALRGQLIRAILDEAHALQVSSAHFLFTTDDDRHELANAGLSRRNDCRFIWNNRNYRDFDDFLSHLTAARRKKIKRERRRIREAGISFEWLNGTEIDTDLWRIVSDLCALTFKARGHEPYINDSCFADIGQRMPQHVKVLIAKQHQEICAAAIFFHDDHALYGRYWGTRQFIDSLHFEACYYQGIELCIASGLNSFDPGTQGEHKLIRGFAPSKTWSWHWFSDSVFAQAIENYLHRERIHIDRYIDMANECLPYRQREHGERHRNRHEETAV